MSLRSRLVLGTVALLSTAVAAALLTAYLLVRHELTAGIDRSLRTRATGIVALSESVSERLQPPQGVRPPRVPPTRFGEPDTYVQLVTEQGRVLRMPDRKVKLPTDGARAVASGARPAFFRDAFVSGAHVRIYTAKAGEGAVQVARSLTDVDGALRWITIAFLAVSAVAIAATAALAVVVSRAILRPVVRLTGELERIAGTRDLRAVTDEGRRDEVGRLARAFDTVLAALRDSLSAQRQLVADASHELRTPLTTARTSLESLDRHPELPPGDRSRTIRVALHELTEMTQLVDELVALARGDADAAEREPVRLDRLVDGAVAVAARRTAREFRTSLEETTVEAAPTELERAVANLLDNAVKWSPNGAPVEVTVSNGAVAVRDHGPGVEPEDAPHVFDRFYRARAARSMPGSGLGLAIVRQVAEMHGGTATVDAAPGGGSIFTVRLPVVDSQQEDSAEAAREPPDRTDLRAPPPRACP